MNDDRHTPKSRLEEITAFLSSQARLQSRTSQDGPAFSPTIPDTKSLQHTLALLENLQKSLIQTSTTELFHDKQALASIIELSSRLHLKDLCNFRGPSEGVDLRQLQQTLNVYTSILCSAAGLRTWLAGPVSADVIAGLLTLANDTSLNIPEEVRSAARTDYLRLLSDCSVVSLLPTLMGLLRPDAPSWARIPLAKDLARIPLKPLGVFMTIENMASMSFESPASNYSVDSEPSGQRSSPIHINSLNRASQVLSIVPEGIDPAKWYRKISLQLQDLLDGNAGPEVVKAAAYITGIGILNRRLKVDKTGMLRWNIFVVEPILSKICPGVDMHEEDHGASPYRGIIVDRETLSKAVHRLFLLLSSHPNPELTKRVFDQMLFPIWNLYRSSMQVSSEPMRSELFALFKLYFLTAASDSQLHNLAMNLFHRPKGPWSYVIVGETGNEGLEIGTLLKATSLLDWADEVMSHLNKGVESFIELLQAVSISAAKLQGLFSAVVTDTIAPSQPEAVTRDLDVTQPDSETIPLGRAVSIQLIHKLLETFPNHLVEDPVTILKLTDSLLKYLIRAVKPDLSEKKVKIPAYMRISQDTQRNEVQPLIESEDEQTASIIFSLLAMLLSSSKSSQLRNGPEGILSIRTSLETLARSATTLGPELDQVLSNLIGLIQVATDGETLQQTSSSNPRLDRLKDEKRIFALCQTYLADETAPVRAEGISLLQSLIKSSSALIDVPSTTLLLTSLLQDSDEYVFLFAIKALVSLAERHPKPTTTMLIERYVDRAGDLDLEQRLRIGEAIARITSQLGQALSNQIAGIIGEACLALAGLREHRLEAKRDDDNGSGDLDEDHKKLQRLMENWEGETGTQDLRLRASALSIFSTMIDVNIRAVGPSLINVGLETATGVLTFETKEEEAIARRAAIAIMLSVAQVMETNAREIDSLEFGISGSSISKLSNTINHLLLSERDELVTAHAESTLAALRTIELRAFIPLSYGSLREGIEELRISNIPTVAPGKIEELD